MGPVDVINQSTLASMRNTETILNHVARDSPSYEPELVFKHTFSVALLLTGLYIVYRWLLPKPLPGIPFNPEAAQSI